jgi:hypothetical protein
MACHHLVSSHGVVEAKTLVLYLVGILFHQEQNLYVALVTGNFHEAVGWRIGRRHVYSGHYFQAGNRLVKGMEGDIGGVPHISAGQEKRLVQHRGFQFKLANGAGQESSDAGVEEDLR